jgi:hypothetical protein
VGAVLADYPTEDFDEAEGGSQPPQGRLLVGVGVELGHRGRLSPRRLVASGPQVQVDPATLEFELILIFSRAQT